MLLDVVKVHDKKLFSAFFIFCNEIIYTVKFRINIVENNTKSINTEKMKKLLITWTILISFRDAWNKVIV